jgi:hypothetical protein
MNSDTVIEIVELAVSLLREVTNHDEPGDTTIDATLIEVAQTTARAYKEHTGELLYPSLIHPEALID